MHRRRRSDRSGSWSRPGLSAVVVVTGLLAGSAIAAAQTAEYSPADKFLGNIWAPAQLPGFTDHWNQVTPENAGKWGPMEPIRGEVNWGPLDDAYRLAKDNGFPFRFHVLIWGNQQPAWIEDLSADAQLAAIRGRFSSIAERYPDIDFLEVVNEPMNDPPRKRDEDDVGSGNYIEALGGTGETGWDWVLTAYRMAREYFPTAELVLNEYSVTNTVESTQRYVELVRLLQAEGLIDVIGVQGHAFSTRVPNEMTRENLDRLAATGLPIQVTEFDIDGQDDEEQLREYQRIFPVFWEHPAVMGVTLWGWRPGMWRTRQGAFLVRQDGTPRPSLEWLMEYVESSRQGH
jgi:endo-1,4-beta-xylanase